MHHLSGKRIGFVATDMIDGNVVSSRKPDDLPAFCQAVVEQLARVPVAS